MISFRVSVLSSSDTYSLDDVDALSSYRVPKAVGRDDVHLEGAWNAETLLVRTASKAKDKVEEQIFITSDVNLSRGSYCAATALLEPGLAIRVVSLIMGTMFRCSD